MRAYFGQPYASDASPARSQDDHARMRDDDARAFISRRQCRIANEDERPMPISMLAERLPDTLGRH